MSDALQLGKQIIREEADALLALADLLGSAFNDAVRLILNCRDQLILTGIGKSGIIARKAAATLASTGTRAVFMHPVEGLHGDLGVAAADSVLLALSKSGQTEELVRFVGHFRRIGGAVIVVCELPLAHGSQLTAHSVSPPLAELADIILPIPARPEAGPLALAPTTSTILQLSLCDALAMALLDARGFSKEQFASYHPDGSLGRRLLLRVRDVMHGGEELPAVRADAAFRDLLLEMNGKQKGVTCVINTDGSLLGVFTDGDLRRLLTRCENPARLSVHEAWRQSRRDPDDPPVRCSTVKPDELAVDCLRLMRDSQITMLVVSEDSKTPVGILRLQDLVRAGLG